MNDSDHHRLLSKIMLAVIITLFIPFMASSYRAQPDTFSFEGRVFNDKTFIAGVSVDIYLNNSKTASALTNRYGVFKVEIQHNRTYILRFSKQGYITEQIQLSTIVKEKVLNEGGITEAFQNDFEILEYFDGLNTDAFNKPVRYFSFNEKTFFFEEETNRSETDKINAIKASITQIKDKLSADELQNGDELFADKKYEEAFLAYNHARNLNPNLELSGKLRQTRRMMRAGKGFEADYKENIAKADELFRSLEYAGAKDRYTKALAVKPEDPYPVNQLIIIDSLTTIGYLTDKREYEKLIVIADEQFNENRLDDALHGYERALELRFDIIYPQQRIDTIKALISAENLKRENERMALEDNYRRFINSGDEYLSKPDYGNALDSYYEALELKPGDNYALDRIKNAKKLQSITTLASAKAQRDRNYISTLSRGDKAYKSKEYKQALVHYRSALKIKPSEKYPAQRIREIDAVLNQLAARKTENPIKDTARLAKPDTVQLSAGDVKQQAYSLLAVAKNLEDQGDKTGSSKAYLDAAQMYHTKGELDDALRSLKKSYALNQQSGDREGQATDLNNMASVYYDSGQYRESIDNYKKALSIKKRLGDEAGELEVLSELGDVLENTYQYEEAAGTLMQALKIQQKLGNTEALSQTSDRLGGLYYNQGDYQNAIVYYNKALNIAETSGNKTAEGSILNDIGVTQYKKGNYDEAIETLNRSVEIDKSINNKRNLSLSYNNIGNVNFNWKKYEKAIEYYQLSLGLKKELNFEQGIAASLYNIGNTYLELTDYSKAKEFLTSALDLSNKLQFNEVIQLTHKSLSRLYESTKDYQNATNSYKSYISVIGTGFIPEGQFSELGASYDRESRLIRSLRRELERQKFLTDYQTLQTLQKQKELQVKDLELEAQMDKNLRNNILLGFSLFLLVFAGFLAFQYYLRYMQKKKYSELISFQKKEIMDSINYASRIQKAVSVPDEQVMQLFPDSFIFSRPKSIVSGDYFYMAAKNGKHYVAVADCTGHGVPGAFMSMLGISLLKEIMWQNKELTADVVLNDLRDACIKALHQTGRDDEAKDGMDIALCVIDPVNMSLEFSGAGNPCYIVRDKTLIELKADRMPIGIHPIMEPFTSKASELRKGDIIYLFSDGYKDQLGGISLKKFKVARFTELLINMSMETMNKQAGMLEKAFLAWQGEMEQTDDIMVAGIRV